MLVVGAWRLLEATSALHEHQWCIVKRPKLGCLTLMRGSIHSDWISTMSIWASGASIRPNGWWLYSSSNCNGQFSCNYWMNEKLIFNCSLLLLNLLLASVELLSSTITTYLLDLLEYSHGYEYYSAFVMLDCINLRNVMLELNLWLLSIRKRKNLLVK